MCLSVAIQNRDSVYNYPEQIQVVKAFSSLVVQVAAFADIGYYSRTF